MYKEHFDFSQKKPHCTYVVNSPATMWHSKQCALPLNFKRRRQVRTAGTMAGGAVSSRFKTNSNKKKTSTQLQTVCLEPDTCHQEKNTTSTQPMYVGTVFWHCPQRPLCSTIGTALEGRRAHLLQHLVQPLQGTVQVKL